MRGRVPSVIADASGLHLKTKWKQKPLFPFCTREPYPIFNPLWKQKPSFSSWMVQHSQSKYCVVTLGIVLLQSSNFPHLPIRILGEKKASKVFNCCFFPLKKVMKEFLTHSPPLPPKRHFCPGHPLSGKIVTDRGR